MNGDQGYDTDPVGVIVALVGGFISAGAAIASSYNIVITSSTEMALVLIFSAGCVITGGLILFSDVVKSVEAPWSQ